MTESGNRAFMDHKAREEWDDKIGKQEVPELTRENIAATFRDLHVNRREMFNRGVLNLFKGLSWDYKTNSPWKFGKRIIVKYLNSYNGNGDKLDDLMRAFCILDNQPEPEYRNSVSVQISNRRYNGFSGVIDTQYFQVQLYKNGNGHLTFNRPDLVEKMNAILGIFYPFSIPQDKREAA